MTESPQWKTVEKVAALLERAVGPTGARVEHNVMLEEVTTGRKRQCDVVIRSGPAARETLSIVEVQDRASPIDALDFDGWIEKRKRLGAQHLIVVSRQQFPQPVIDLIEKVLGPFEVRLMRLRQLEAGESPLVGWTTFDLHVPRYAFDPGHQVLIESQMPAPTLNIKLTDPVFRIGSREPKSIADLMDGAFKKASISPMPPGEFDSKIEFTPTEEFSVEIGGQAVPIRRLEIPTKVIIQVQTIPITLSAYESVGSSGSDGVLAWAATATSVVAGRDFSLRMTFVPLGDGQFAVRAEHELEGSKGLHIAARVIPQSTPPV